MSDYAVINPATGETVKTYPRITDEQLEAALRGLDVRPHDRALLPNVPP